jgi:hypothetical protein
MQTYDVPASVQFGIKCQPVLRCLPFLWVTTGKHGCRFDLRPFNRARQSRDSVGVTAFNEALDEKIDGTFAGWFGIPKCRCHRFPKKKTPEKGGALLIKIERPNRPSRLATYGGRPKMEKKAV